MSFLNIPLKSIQANITSATGVATMPWYNPLLFPVVPPNLQPVPTQRDFRWRVEMDINEQQHSSYITRLPGNYNGQDISVGQWIASLTTGQAWQIITIEAKTTSHVTAVVQDVYRYNTFRDPAQVGNGSPGTGVFVVFNIGDDGLPLIDPVPPAGTSFTFSTNLQSRFEYINLQYDYPLYQPNNSFVINDVIAIDSVSNAFALSDSTNTLVIGRVTSISDTVSGWFTINPVQKIVDNLDYLPGNVGDIIYSSTVDPGGITVDPGGSQIYIKLRNNTSSASLSTIPGATTVPGNIFQLNGIDILMQTPADMTSVVNAANLEYALTLVDASLTFTPTEVYTDNSLVSTTYGEPALWAANSPSSATINDVLVIFDITSTDAGYTDYARPTQMAESINLASIPNIVASINGPLSLVITNTTGGSINIANVANDINGVPFAGIASGSGLSLTTIPSTTQQIKFTAVDARPINFLDVIGNTVDDMGLVSVENGIKACGLYIEDGLRTATSTVVTNLAQLNGLNPLIGDQAYVINSVDAQGNNDGEWSLWLYNGTNWVQTSNQDSASTDAKSLEYMLSVTSPSSAIMGQISTGRRVTLITIEVITPFDSLATLEIGYHVNNVIPQPPMPSGLMSLALTDLTVAGTYTTSTDILFGSDTAQGDVNITTSFNSAGSITGMAQIIVSYV